MLDSLCAVCSMRLRQASGVVPCVKLQDLEHVCLGSGG